MENIKQTPEGIALIICDQVITDARTHKKTLVGIFNQIAARKFPVVHPNLGIFLSISQGKGAYDGKLKLIHEDSDETLVSLNGNVKFENPLQIVEVSFIINNLGFKQAGNYRFEFTCDDIPVLTRRFIVSQLNPPDAGQNPER